MPPRGRMPELPEQAHGPELVELVRDLREVVESFRDVPILDHSEVTAELVAGDNDIPHKLDRQPVGWIVTDMTTGAVGLRRVSWDATYLTLNSSGGATVALWVF